MIKKIGLYFIFISSIFTISVIIFGIYHYFSFIRFNERTQLAQEFIESVYENISTHGYVDFDIIADFEWDNLLLIAPYNNPRTVFEEEGIPWFWGRLNTNIRYHEGINLLVFLNDKRVIHHIEYPRFMGNLACYDPIRFGGHVILERNNTRFQVHDGIGLPEQPCLLPY